jgi:hypothetical protein
LVKVCCAKATLTAKEQIRKKMILRIGFKF